MSSHEYYLKHKEIWKNRYKENKKKLLDYAKKYRDNVLDKKKHKEYMQEYYQEDKEKFLVKAYQRRQKLDKEKERKYQREYHQKYREKLNKQSLQRYYQNKDNEKKK